MTIKRKNCTTQRYAAVFWRLFRMYSAALLGINRFNEYILKKQNGFNKKSLLKIVLLTVLFVYVGACFIIFFASMFINVYKALRPLGMQRLIFELVLLTLFFFLFVPQFLLTLSTYSIGGIEQTLRAMPIPSRIFFGSKFCAHCILPALFSLSFLTIAAAVYGIYEHPPLSFYAVIFIGALLFPLPVISCCYMFHIIIMRFTVFFKNKQVVMMITGLLGLFLALAVNVMAQTANGLQQNRIAAVSLAEKRNAIAALMAYFLSGKLFTDALSAQNLAGRLSAFIPFALICIALPVALVIGFSGMYEKSLDGFDEKKIKKLKAAERSALFQNVLMKRPVFIALLIREIRMMNREPVYLLNGPFTILLVPLIFGIMYGTGSLHVPSGAAQHMQGGFGALLAGVCGAFLGSAPGIAAAAVSRDAKNLWLIKSFPLPLNRYMQAKLVHAMLFAFIGSIAGTGGIALLFSLSAGDICIALLIAVSLALFCNLIALILDTVRPKLHWDNPAAAVKQNMNVFIMTFTDMVLLSAAAVTAALTDMPQWLYTVLFAGLPLIFSAVIAHFFWPYAERKIYNLDV